MLQQAGWDEVWEEKFADFAGKGLRPARVLAQYRNSYSLWTAAGEADAEIAGALLYRAEPGGLPVVGDWVAIRQYAPTDLAIITDVFAAKDEVFPQSKRLGRGRTGNCRKYRPAVDCLRAGP